MKTCECALEIIDISKESHLQNASLDEEDFERVAKVVTELVLNYLFLLQKCGPEWVDDFGAATKLGRTKKATTTTTCKTKSKWRHSVEELKKAFSLSRWNVDETECDEARSPYCNTTQNFI